MKVSSAGIDKSISRRYFPATWFRLFKGLRLDEKLYDSFKDDYSTAPYLADYLPSDVQAVPTRIDINLIVALAAAAGCHRMDLDKETDYPNIIGSNSQIRFRRDLHFGIVAFFEHFVLSEPQDHVYEQDLQLYRIIGQTTGDFAFGEARASISVIGGRDIISYRGHTLDPTGLRRPYTLYGPSIYAEKGPGSCRHAEKSNSLCQALDAVTHFASFSNFSWLLWGEPFEISYIFPAAATNLTFILEVMAAQGSFWSVIRSPNPSFMRD